MPRKSAVAKATNETASLRAGAAEADVKASNLLRLRRIEGQIRGLQKMVEQDRRCPDILMQVASVQQALKGVTRELVRNHLEQCALRAVTGSGPRAEEAVNELLAVWSKHAG